MEVTVIAEQSNLSFGLSFEKENEGIAPPDESLLFSFDTLLKNLSENQENGDNLPKSKAEELGFDPVNIVNGPPVYVRKQVFYQAFAATTFSVEQATNIIDYIGHQVDSEDCLPFAIKLIENGQVISIAEDNGEFACGNILAKCLKKLDGFNVLVCVARKVKGCYVTDMIQCQKLHVVKEAADKALEILHKRVTGQELPKEGDELKNVPEPPQSQQPQPLQIQPPLSTISSKNTAFPHKPSNSMKSKNKNPRK
jgi:hypothetical protein